MILSSWVGGRPRSSLVPRTVETSCRESLRAKNRRHDDLGAGVELVMNGANDAAHSHGMVLRIVAEFLRDGRIAKEEGEVAQNILPRRANGTGGRKLLGKLGLRVTHDNKICDETVGGQAPKTPRIFTREWVECLRLAGVCAYQKSFSRLPKC